MENVIDFLLIKTNVGLVSPYENKPFEHSFIFKREVQPLNVKNVLYPSTDIILLHVSYIVMARKFTQLYHSFNWEKQLYTHIKFCNFEEV